MYLQRELGLRHQKLVADAQQNHRVAMKFLKASLGRCVDSLSSCHLWGADPPEWVTCLVWKPSGIYRRVVHQGQTGVSGFEPLLLRSEGASSLENRFRGVLAPSGPRSSLPR